MFGNVTLPSTLLPLTVFGLGNIVNKVRALKCTANMEEVRNLDSNFAGILKGTKKEIDRIVDVVTEETFIYPPFLISRSISVPEEFGATSISESDAKDSPSVKDLQYGLVQVRKRGALAMQNQIRRATKRAVDSLETQLKFTDSFLKARNTIHNFDIPPVADLTDVKKEYEKLKEDFGKRQKLMELLERKKTCPISLYVDKILKE